jgi:heat shock protein HslJ
VTRSLLAVAAMLVAGTAAPSGGHHASSSERAGQGRFDARAQIPCTLQKGQPMGRCKAAVARDPGGTATVVVTRPDGRTRAIFFSAILWAGLVLAGGGPSDAQTSGSPLVNGLADTRWRLVEFQSMDDAAGTTRPSDPSLYTMELHGDGTVAMRLNCNRATGGWSAVPAGDGTSGRFEFGTLAATRALCPPPSMDESIVAQSAFIRSYLLKDGRLYLSLMADGGIYAWEPAAGQPSVADDPAASEDGGPRGYAAAEFLKPAVSPGGSVATGPDDSAPSSSGGDRAFAPGTSEDHAVIARPEGP